MSIRLTPGTEIVRATADQIVFCANRPRRTFEIDREAAHGFRVRETSLFQSAGRQGRPTVGHEHNVISQGQMNKWVSARLEEVRAAAIFSGGLSLPEASTMVMMVASALITLWASTV
jgi:hypothetical protein